MTNNKKKGKRVERAAAKIMSDLTGEEWQRTVFSGAMSHHRDNQVYKGDIHVTNKESTYKNIIVEVKARKDSIKAQELFTTKSRLSKYTRQATKQSEGSNWLLLVKVNYEGWFVFYPEDKQEMLEPILHDITWKTESPAKENYAYIKIGRLDL